MIVHLAPVIDPLAVTSIALSFYFAMIIISRDTNGGKTL